ncbi:hypothetical protein M378DRAFT_960547 [Amanita muscaria Koide BX008]|uniref:Uncharacterized protein n=1 Tax=Amanita muscaria (strain Koide BX008) TaxID=946122 RepID=A0A0C2WUL6_AMAMK|nr:hypothetical protein M378DRAFT_960547 [Amanita muscaria Koide BX008]
MSNKLVTECLRLLSTSVRSSYLRKILDLSHSRLLSSTLLQLRMVPLLVKQTDLHLTVSTGRSRPCQQSFLSLQNGTRVLPLVNQSEPALNKDYALRREVRASWTKGTDNRRIRLAPSLPHTSLSRRTILKR